MPCCCCMMGRLQHGAQSISLTGAIVHYVSEMTPKTSHNPWVRFSPPCCSGALIFILSCPSSPTSNALSHFFFAHFLLIHRHLPQHLFDGRSGRREKVSSFGFSYNFLCSSLCLRLFFWSEPKPPPLSAT